MKKTPSAKIMFNIDFALLNNVKHSRVVTVYCQSWAFFISRNSSQNSFYEKKYGYAHM